MSRKYLIIGGIILVLLFIMVGLLLMTGNKPTQTTGNVELTWWKTFETTENVQQLISDYETVHKNVTINYVQKDVSTYQQDLLNAFASDQAPDIFSIHNDWLPLQMDKLTPMPESVMNVRQYKSTFVDVATDDFVKDNKIYALPMNVDVLALYYNKDLLGSSGIALPPKNWSELEKDVEKITKVNKPGTFSRSGIALGTAANVNRAVDILTLLMLQNGTKFYNADKTSVEFDQSQSDTGVDFNPGIEALKYFTQFSDPAKKSYTWNAQSDNSVDAFTQGKLAMMLSYYYMRPQVLDKGPNLNWDVAAAPQISNDNAITKVNFANYWGETVSKNSVNAAAAWDFLNFITSKEELDKYYSQHKLVASRKDMLTQQTADPDLGVYAESALTAKSVYKVDPSGYEAVFAKMIDDISVKGMPIEESLSNASQQINAQLQK